MITGNTRSPAIFVAPTCTDICRTYLLRRGASEVAGLRCTCTDPYASNLTACSSCIAINPADGQTGLDESPQDFDSECSHYFGTETTGWATPSQTSLPTATRTGAGATPTFQQISEVPAVYAGEDGTGVAPYVAAPCLAECEEFATRQRIWYQSINTTLYGQRCFPAFIAALSGCLHCH